MLAHTVWSNSSRNFIPFKILYLSWRRTPWLQNFTKRKPHRSVMMKELHISRTVTRKECNVSGIVQKDNFTDLYLSWKIIPQFCYCLDGEFWNITVPGLSWSRRAPQLQKCPSRRTPQIRFWIKEGQIQFQNHAEEGTWNENSPEEAPDEASLQEHLESVKLKTVESSPLRVC